MSVPAVTPEGIRRQIDIYTPHSPMRFGAVGDGVANDLAALQATISAASTGDVIDLGDRTYNVAAPITISKGVTIKNGALISSVNRVCLLTAQNVTMKDVTVTRTGGTTASTAACVVNASGSRFIDCIMSSSQEQALRLANGNSNRTKVIGGKYTTSTAVDSAAITLLSGVVHNYDVVIRNAEIRNTGYGSGITLFNCSRSTVDTCDVQGIRRSPLVTFSNWENTAGNIYRTLDRADGTTTNAVYVNGVEYPGSSQVLNTSPTEGNYGISGGYVYIQLIGGGNPNSVTVTGTRTNGYGILFYSSSGESLGMKDNLAKHNYVEDVDGFGIYIQTLANIPENNRTLQNTLRRTCLTGVTVGLLPFAAIGVFGGKGVLLEGDYIDGVGTEETPAPGIDFKFSRDCPFVEGSVVGATVTNATSHGISVTQGDFKIAQCRVYDNAGNAITSGLIQSGETCEVELVANSCFRNNNGAAFGSSAGSFTRVTVNGGRYYDNTVRNINISRCREWYIGGGVVSHNAGNIGISVSNTSLRGIIGDVFLRSGLGIGISDDMADLFVGNVCHDGSSGTKFNTAGPYRLAGVKGFPAVWVIPSGHSFVTPEANITAAPGSLCVYGGGGTSTTLYVKESGTGNTGWVAK